MSGAWLCAPGAAADALEHRPTATDTPPLAASALTCPGSTPANRADALALSQVNDLYQLPELICFAVIGIVSGFVGAAFNAANRRLTLWRNRVLTTRRSRLLEAATVALLTALACFSLPFLLPCAPAPTPYSPYPPPPPPSNTSRPQPPVVPSHCHAHKTNPLQHRMHSLVCGEDGLDSALVRLLLSPVCEPLECPTNDDGPQPTP